MVQLNPRPAYDQALSDRVVVFLQTRDSNLFPFTGRFTTAQLRAFTHDLREGLSDLVDSGSARKTSASGFIMHDRRLHEIVNEWAAANGGWPMGSDPRDPVTSLGTPDPEAPMPPIVKDAGRWKR